MNLLRPKLLLLFGESGGAGKQPGRKAVTGTALPSSARRGEGPGTRRLDVSSEKRESLAEPIATEVLRFRGKVDVLKRGFAPNCNRNNDLRNSAQKRISGKGRECLYRAFKVSCWNLILFSSFDSIISAFFQNVSAVVLLLAFHAVTKQQRRLQIRFYFRLITGSNGLAGTGRTLLCYRETERCCYFLALKGAEAQGKSAKQVKTSTRAHTV